MQTIITKSNDELAVKSTKNIISTAVPVVGKVLSDTTEVVLGCANILKSATGIFGIIIITLILIIPIIKVGTLMICYYFTSAVCQILADESIVKLIDELGDSFKVMLAILCSMLFLVLIGTVIILKAATIV